MGMSIPEVTDVRTCGFPGCAEPVDATPGVGRPAGYCVNPAHNRAAAWRARRAEAGRAERTVEDDKLPVDAARQRASVLRAQVAGMVEHLQQQLVVLVDELRTVADPDAAEAQIEAVTSDAAEQVASAAARANRAETATRKAETERAEADAAAEESATQGDELRIVLAALEQRAASLEGDLVVAGENEARAAAEITALTAQVAALTAQNAAATAQLTDAQELLTTTTAAKDDAQAAARGAIAQADAATTRAERAETETASTRDLLDQTREERESARAEALILTGRLATLSSERDSATAEAGRERSYAEQRVTDVRDALEQQLTQLRTDLDQARTSEREQRTRADRAEAQTARPKQK
ncbi:colicin import membrane protein [Cryobacterium sp. MP_M5]|nr:colicin import membrane protein [Cryobacterium sp. MP_M5]